MKIPFLLLALLLVVQPVRTQSIHETPAQHNARMNWWRDARFGLFIHWGLYSVPAGEWGGKTGYGEWIRTSAQIRVGEYEKFVGQFNPVSFNADEWVRMAKEAGMRYIVITTKHHDGFCLFESKYTDFDVMSTPFHRDIMKELSDACHRQGMPICWYHSIMDWHHPDYLPRRNWETDRSTEGADFPRYVTYLKNELGELLTNYGKIGVLWFDGEWEATWNTTLGGDLYNYVRSLQPGIIVNNRVHAPAPDAEAGGDRGYGGGDFGTPEQEIPATGLPGVDWETCMTMNDHWGYNSHDKNFKSTKELIRNLADIASKGGNFLLNVGPTAEGLFPQESIERLAEIGRWMKMNGESIHGTFASPFKKLDWGRCTQRLVWGGSGAILFLHVFDWPVSGKLVVPGLFNLPQQAFLLADTTQRPLVVERNEDALVINLPSTPPDSIDPVVVLEISGIPDVSNPPLFSAGNPIFIDTLHVTIRAEMNNADVHYTTDGSMPTVSSDIASHPVVLDHSAVVRARCFRHGKPVSAVSEESYTKVTPFPALKIQEGDVENGIAYKYYEGIWDSLPDFTTIHPVRVGEDSVISLVPRHRPENFATVYDGYINVLSDDVYTFYIGSDDGSRLRIDTTVVVNNDGLHGMLEKSGAAALAAGWHPIHVEYFNKTGDFGLKVSYRNHMSGKQEIPRSILVQEE